MAFIHLLDQTPGAGQEQQQNYWQLTNVWWTVRKKLLVSVHLLTDGQVSAMLTTVTTTGTSKCLRQTEHCEMLQL